MSRDPSYGDMDALRNLVDRGPPIRVYKSGAATGLTDGFLSSVHPILYHEQKANETETIGWCLAVDWVSPASPFALSGDSGSLVWAQDGTTMIPLGLHCGSQETTSFALSLWSIFEETTFSLEADLVFCVAEECGKERICNPPGQL